MSPDELAEHLQTAHGRRGVPDDPATVHAMLHDVRANHGHSHDDEPLDGPQFGEPGYSAVPPTPDADPDVSYSAPGDALVEQAAAEVSAERAEAQPFTAEGVAAAYAEPRSYVIGLPVVISVYPDGRVTAEVDLSEMTDLGDGVPTEGEGTLEVPLRPLYDEAEVDADVEAVRLAYEEGRVGLVPSFGTYLRDGSAGVAVVLSVPNNPRSGDELTERDVEEGLRARLDEFYPWDDGYPEVPDVRSVTVVL